MKYSLRLQTLLVLLLISSCSGNSPAAQSPTQTASQSIFFKNTTVTLTFDDGNADNFSVRSVLAANRVHATFYVPSGLTGTNGFLTAAQLHDLYSDGNEIGGHTLDHVKLTDMHRADLRREVCEDRLNLLGMGLHVTSFAFPFGHYDAESRQTVIDCGYNSARIVTDGPDTIPPGDRFALQAMPYIVKDTDFSKLLRYVKGVQADGGGWAILIFHHICNGCDQYAMDLNTFTNFAQWLAYQRDANGLTIKTIDEVVGGTMKPGVNP